MRNLSDIRRGMQRLRRRSGRIAPLGAGRPLLLLCLLGAGAAWAQSGSWGSYESAFPAFPCQDGWMGCIQDGKRVDPDIQRDGSGMPVPADLRVGWFDLKPTANFSPFVGLSKYTGAEPKTAAAPVPDGTPDGTADAGNTPDPDAGGGDGVAAVEPSNFFDPEAERARREAEDRRIAEAEAERRRREADAEVERARRDAEERARLANVQQARAEQALQAARNAESEAERQRLQADAKRAQEAQAKAQEEARRAREVERQRQAEAEAEQRAAAAASAAAKRAEEERQRAEAAEARKAAERERAETAAKAKAEADAKAAADAARRAAEADAAKAAREAEALAKAAEVAAAAAQSEAAKAAAEQQKREAEEARRRAADEAKAKADEAAAAAATAAREKAEAEQRERLAADQKKAEEQRRQFEEAERQRKAAESTEAVVAGAEGCADLVALERVAILGRLPPEQVSCLESSLQGAERMTQKSKISRVLMSNAFSAGDDSWETLMKRHLEEIEQSDPDLCYKYALHLSKKTSASAAYGVIRWANVALENRTVWTGSTYTSRVFSLYKVRAVAAQRLWQDLENAHAASPNEESNQKVKDSRNQTKVFAREWYEYAKVSGKDPTTALNLCMSAAGTKDYCEAG